MSRSTSRGAYKSVRPVAKRVGYTRAVGNYGRFRGVSKPELKWFDCPFEQTDASVSPNGIIQDSGSVLFLTPGGSGSLNLIGAGSGASQRIGRKVLLRHLESHIRIMFKTQSVTLSASDRSIGVRCRWVVLIDHQCNGTAVSAKATEVFASPSSVALGSGDTTIANSFSPRNLANSKRFTLLHDRVYTWTPKCIQTQYSNATPSVPSAATFVVEGGTMCKNFSTVLNTPVEFDSSGGVPAITNVRSNNLVSFVMIDPYFTLDDVRVDGIHRVRYSDV